jgi:hypothetical protein
MPILSTYFFCKFDGLKKFNATATVKTLDKDVVGNSEVKKALEEEMASGSKTRVGADPSTVKIEEADEEIAVLVSKVKMEVECLKTVQRQLFGVVNQDNLE